MRYLILLAILLVPLSAHAYCMDDDYECWERVRERSEDLCMSTASTVPLGVIGFNSGCLSDACITMVLFDDFSTLLTKCTPSGGCQQLYCTTLADESCHPI